MERHEEGRASGRAHLTGAARWTEPHWIAYDSKPRQKGEPCEAYVSRSAAEVLAGFQRVCHETDFRQVASESHHRPGPAPAELDRGPGRPRGVPVPVPVSRARAEGGAHDARPLWRGVLRLQRADRSHLAPPTARGPLKRRTRVRPGECSGIAEPAKRDLGGSVGIANWRHAARHRRPFRAHACLKRTTLAAFVIQSTRPIRADGGIVPPHYSSG